MSSNPVIKLDDFEYYFISGKLPENYGGLTKSLLQRCKLFSEKLALKTTFLTFSFDLNLEEKKQKLYSHNVINQNMTSIINMYDDYLSQETKPKRIYHEYIPPSELKAYINKKENLLQKLLKFQNTISIIKPVITYYKGESLVKYVDFYTGSKFRYKREYYKRSGQLALVSYYDVKSNQVVYQEFINTKLEVYLEKTFVFLTDTNQLESVIWYSREGPLFFNDETLVRQRFIEYLQQRNNDPKLFLVDSRPQDKFVFSVKKSPNVFYAAIIHNKHYNKQKYEIKGRYNQLFKRINSLDAVFFITEEQLEDVKNLLPYNKHRFFYTPHTIEKSINKEMVLHSKRVPNTIVIVSRFGKMKNLQDAVKAFSLVTKEIPEAKLNIYGSGEEELLIKNEIKRLKLEKNVILKGYTLNPDQEFRKAWLTMSTSHFEGFGLSNLEALSNGCPVVTYDYDYGARSLIVNGENGYIVKQYNIQELANSIIKLLLKSQTEHQIFSQQALNTAEKYSIHQYITHWVKAIEGMVNARLETDKATDSLEGSCSVKEHSFENNVLTMRFSLPKSSTRYSYSLLGVNRKNNIEVINQSIFDNKVTIELASLKIPINMIVDFYVIVFNEKLNHQLLYRLSVPPNLIISNEEFFSGAIEPYSTVKNNYSWKVDHVEKLL
ncbi:alpha-glucosyltransferase N-terminal domain-containing protein [Shouchella clausii]|uniref:alpha-glucosyltransferase N-terminal domain-containing protein n=1 Tax=Shouchella clausii TaxID=79880 RepID=UPI000BA5BEC6|nr:alpha-glucosyltransferase N-terminal domain-containing protein [Shouchella clausii]PAE94389.1 hypothetical protein CHH70_07340 [Shouchella clausii]